MAPTVLTSSDTATEGETMRSLIRAALGVTVLILGATGAATADWAGQDPQALPYTLQ